MTSGVSSLLARRRNRVRRRELVLTERAKGLQNMVREAQIVSRDLERYLEERLDALQRLSTQVDHRERLASLSPEQVEALTAFHDELDLAPMKVKVKVGGGTAGHNGLRSIGASIGPDFRRVRIGIGHPGPGQKDKVTPHVLGNYAKSEMEPLSDLLGAVAAEASWLADGDDVRFMSEVALRLQQPD